VAPPPAAGEFQVAPVVAAARPDPSSIGVQAVPAARPFSEKAPVPAPPPSSDFAFDSQLDEAGVDFGEMAMPAAASVSDLAAGMAPDDRVQELLDQGQAAFDAGDFQGAIETWSRIYLVDAHHAEAELRIEQARRRREEVERLAEHRFYEAREAFEEGRPDDARTLCQEVLSIQPQHLEAHDLLQRLETPAAPPPTPTSSLAADEEDLFRDDFVPATIATTQLSTTSPLAAGVTRERLARGTADQKGARKIAGLPMMWVAAGGGVLVLVLAGALFMGGKLFSRGSDSVSASLSIADGLAERGQLADAIRVLENLSGQLEGEQANLVNERIQSLKKRLKAQATPVPSFDTQAIRATMVGGQRLKAWQMVQDGLGKVPSEPELLAIQGELTSYSAMLPTLAAALRESNWEHARQVADRMRQDHPDDVELGQVWAVATYNLAIISLRKYQIAPANSLLADLAKQGDDPVVAKVQQFARSYLSRPADPRYDLFVNNIELRKVD
jgi:tetratricopeptide (TPR) repeat protein